MSACGEIIVPPAAAFPGESGTEALSFVVCSVPVPSAALIDLLQRQTLV